jgi:biotin synthase
MKVTIHREHHDPNVVQVSTPLSIKTGGLPKIAAIAHKCCYHTEIEGNDLPSQAK